MADENAGAGYGAYDIGEAALSEERAGSRDPEVLDELVRISRGLFGWFNRRRTRADEYVWVAGQCSGIAGGAVLDIGAGVSPLPLYLSRRNRVVTVDNSEIRRVRGAGEKEWNGWGFFDYASVGANVVSLNEDVVAADFGEGSFDCIYSVSVIEHMPAEARRLLWVRAATWLKHRGLLLLTLDLVPDTSRLWNLDRGRVIEDASAHGDMAAVVGELGRSGFDLVSQEVLRGFADEPRTDVGLMSFVKRGAVGTSAPGPFGLTKGEEVT